MKNEYLIILLFLLVPLCALAQSPYKIDIEYPDRNSTLYFTPGWAWTAITLEKNSDGSYYFNDFTFSLVTLVLEMPDFIDLAYLLTKDSGVTVTAHWKWYVGICMMYIDLPKETFTWVNLTLT